jgi:TP901 family phage tail tape measure protein
MGLFSCYNFSNRQLPLLAKIKEMAKTISDEKIKLSIIIDGNPAQKELFDLEKSTRDLTKQQAELRKEKQLMEKQGKQETEQYKAVTASIKENSAAIAANKTRMKELQDEIGLTGLTMKQLGDKSVHLKMVLRNLIPGSEDYKRYQKDLEAVTKRLDELRGKGKEAGLSIGGLADKFNRYQAMAATVLLAVTGVVLTFQKWMDFNGKLSDSISNVQKTTGMTKREVDDLAKSFGVLKTRTGRIELLGIAEVGGRLGIAKEEIKDFVRVMDKSAVALGDSFEGGPEVVAEKLGRIKGLYKDLRESGVEQVFESVGSAMNDLGADGTASEANIAEFVTRIGAMPEAFKPSIQTALGLGAAFEESGLKAEIAATNYSKVISIASRDMGAFATVMQRPRKELEDLINTNPNEFFLQFASSLKGLDATELGQVLDYLKLNDNEVKMVLGAASEKVDIFREKIALAGSSMADATSLTNEYDIKNNNLAATLERLKKTAMGWFTSDTIVVWLTAAVDGFAKLVGAVEDNDGAMTGFRNTIVFLAKILAIVVASMLSYTAGAKLATLWSNNMNIATAYSNILFKIQYAQLVAQEVATKALALAKALLTGNINRVKAAYQALSVAMGMNPFGALLAVIGAVVAAFIVFRDEAEQVNNVVKAQAEVQKLAGEQTAKTKQKVSDLVAVIRDENSTYKQKQEALEQLKKIGQGYLEGLTLENIATAEGTRLINRYIASIDQLAKAKAMVNVKSKLLEQQLEADNKVLALSLEKKANKNEGMAGGGDDGKFFGMGDRNKKEIQSEMEAEMENRDRIKDQVKAIDQQRQAEIDNLRKSITDKTNQLKKLQKDSKQYKELLVDIKSTQGSLGVLMGLEDAGPSSPNVKKAFVPDAEGDKAADKAKAKADKLHKERMDSLKKQIEELRDLERKGIDDKLSLIKDGFERELAIQEESHRRKLEDYNRQLISDKDIQNADANIKSPKSSKEEVDYWTRQKEVWLEKNKHLNFMIQTEEQIHLSKLGTIIENERTRRIKEQAKQHEREKMLRETAQLEELAAITTVAEAKAAIGDYISKNELDKIKTLADAKKVLQEKYNNDEQKREIEYIEDSIAKMEKSLEKIHMLGFDLSLLTPEQRKKIEEDIEFAKNASAKLKAALTGKNGEGTPEQDKETRNQQSKDAFNNLNGGLDVLGFSPDQWKQTFNNLDTLYGKMMAGAMVVQGLQNLWGQYSSYMDANENNQLKKFEKTADARKRKLQWQLDNGLISQAQYKRATEKIDAETERKKADIEYKQAKRKKAMSIAETIMNTSIAIMQGYAQLGPIGGSIAAAIVGTLGLLQLKNIAQQPLPARGYEEGLYQDVVREQDGKVFKSRYGGKTRSGVVNRPTHFLTGENGPEMIIDAKAYRTMPEETKTALLNHIRRVKGFESGYYNDDARNPTLQVPAGPAAPAASGTVSNEYLLSVINRNSEVLERALKEGFTGYFSRDYRDLKKMKDELDRLENSKAKAKI